MGRERMEGQTLGVNICMQGMLTPTRSQASWPRRGRAAREGPIAIGGILDPTQFSLTSHLFLPPFLSAPSAPSKRQ